MTSNKLPKNWHTMSLRRLWDELNNPQHFHSPQATIEAILFTVRERGIEALDEPDNKERLSRCDAAAMTQIHERIDRMRQKGIVR